MKNSKKILFTLSVFQTFTTSALTASSNNMFDQAVDFEMVQIHNEYVADCKKAKITHLLIDTIVDPRIHPDIVKHYKSLPQLSMIATLMNAYFSKHIALKVVDTETVKLFNKCRNQIVGMYNQKDLSLEEAVLGLGILPDASPEQMFEAGKVIANQGGSEQHVGWIYWKSGKHSNATFEHVLTIARQINKMGPAHGINAVTLILEELIARNQSLTAEEVEIAKQKIIDIATSSGDFLNIAKLIMDDFPQCKELASQIIRNGINQRSLDVNELEGALSLIRELSPHDQGTIHRLTKRIGSKSRVITVN